MDWLLTHLRTELFRLSGTSVSLASIAALALTLAATAFAARLTRRAVSRFLHRRGVNHDEGAVYAIARISQYAVTFVGLMLGLENVGVSLATVAALGAVVTVGIGFGLQNIAQNFISGLILLVERPVRKGDFVRIGESLGLVEDIAMRATRLASLDGEVIIVPNSELITKAVVNRSRPTRDYRHVVLVRVAQGADAAAVRGALLGAAQGEPRVRAAPPPAVFFANFGDGSLDFELEVWIDDPQLGSEVTSALRFAIDAAFRSAGIALAAPTGARPPREPAARSAGPAES